MSLDRSLNKILIVDFGSQFTQLIARRIRELGVFSKIVSHKKIKINDIDDSIKGIILSGGPLNVYEIKKYSFDKRIIKNEITYQYFATICVSYLRMKLNSIKLFKFISNNSKLGILA